MQELKVEEDKFPFDAFRALGYQVVIAAQKTYNGVAIASRTPITDVRRGLDDGVEDPQARLISGVVDGVRIMSVYVPNGQAVGTDKFEYKLQWMDRLRARPRGALRPRGADGHRAATSTSRPRPRTCTTRWRGRRRRCFTSTRGAALEKHPRLGAGRPVPAAPLGSGLLLVVGLPDARRSPRTAGCASITSSPPSRSRGAATPAGSIARRARGRSRRTTRRCWPRSAAG